MHISKHTAFLTMIGYLLARIVLQDWWLVTESTGRASILALVWLGGGLLLIALFTAKLAGPALFTTDADDEATLVIHPDLHFTDTGLFAFAFANVLASLCWHVWQETTSTDLSASYWLGWIVGEVVLLAGLAILFLHAKAVQRKLHQTCRRAFAEAQTASAADDAVFSPMCQTQAPILANRPAAVDSSNFRQAG